MLRFSVRLDDMTRIARDQFNTRRKRNLLSAAMIWHASVLDTLSGPRSGREYPVPGTGTVQKVQITTRRGHKMTVRKLVGATMYRASRPGDAPASMLGQLRQSYRFTVRGPNYMEYGEVGSPLEKAVWLEKGTQRMAPRPHLEAAFHKRRQEIINELRRRWD